MKISLNFPDNLLTKMDEYCEKHDYERSEFIRMLVRQLLEGALPAVKVEGSIPTSTLPPEKTFVSMGTTPKENISVMGTMPVKYKYVVSGLHPTGETIPASSSTPTDTVKVNMPEALWEDYNLMPVYKTGVPDQYCVTWHSKGERRTVYPIKKFRPDGSLELEGKYCKDCIKEFLAKDGHLE